MEIILNEYKYKNDNALNNKKLHQSHTFKFNFTYMTYLNLISAENYQIYTSKITKKYTKLSK